MTHITFNMVSDELKVKLGGVWVEEVGPVEGVHGAKGGGQEDEGEPVDGGDHPRLLDVVSQEEDGAELNLGIRDSGLVNNRLVITSSTKTKRMQETIQMSRQVT